MVPSVYAKFESVQVYLDNVFKCFQHVSCVIFVQYADADDTNGHVENEKEGKEITLEIQSAWSHILPNSFKFFL